jgi:hypothetical protein
VTIFDSEADRARFLGLCAAGRYAEAESMLSIIFPVGSSVDGGEVVSRGAFYEDWGDAVAELDPAAARTAYAQAEELFATFASWATAGGEGLARMVDVERVIGKRRALDVDSAPAT